MMLLQHSVDSDWLFNTQSRVLQADLFILEIDEKATLNINCLMSQLSLIVKFGQVIPLGVMTTAEYCVPK